MSLLTNEKTTHYFAKIRFGYWIGGDGFAAAASLSLTAA